MDLEIYLGIPYAKPPTGNLRFARPEPPTPWTEVRDATKHGPKCIQRIIPEDPVLTNVPFGEDCLFVDVYTPRYKNDPSTTQVPTMMFIHGGGFYGGSGAKYNYTNVALRGVTVVSVSYRLDIFGFLSTEDDVIPGNFGLLDQALALDWIRANIGEFGGRPDKITLFGGSSGGVSTSILTLSPLTRGKFEGAIMESGAAACPWGVYTPDRTYAAPRDLAKQLGDRARCTLSQTNFSTALLQCLRNISAEDLVKESVYIQEQRYEGNMIFTPVVETTFGVLPESPLELLNKTDDLVHIPTIYGYTHDDGSFIFSDRDNDGVTLREFKLVVEYFTRVYYPESYRADIYEKVKEKYLPEDPSTLSKLELRRILVEAMTGSFDVGCMIQEARLFSKAKTGENTDSYVYEFNHRPSYSYNPEWMGVAHADEKGFVLGLPVGPDPFKYPNHTADDATVADFVVTTWTNFAKYGNPTPSPVHNVTWPQFRPGHEEKVMVIQVSPEVKDFDRSIDVEVWTNVSRKGKGNAGYHTTGQWDLVGPSSVLTMLLWKLFYYGYY